MYEIVVIILGIRIKVCVRYTDDIQLVNHNVDLKQEHFVIILSILFIYHWQIENVLLCLCLGPGLKSTYPAQP